MHRLQKSMDAETFTAEVVRYQTVWFRTARAILSNDQDAEDAVQEAICAAFASRSSLRDVTKFKSWMLRILTNQCYDLCRKRRPAVELGEVADVLPAKDGDPAEKLTLWQAVLSLKQEQRAVITLFYYDGLSVREISQALHISESAVKTRLFRGRNALYERLQESEE